MNTKNLKEVWISKYTKRNDYGEEKKVWQFKRQKTKRGSAFLNLQQDLNELDRKSTGVIDYSIENARTTEAFEIENGDGVSLTNISKQNSFEPDFIVINTQKIGRTTLYKLEKNNVKSKNTNKEQI